MGKYDTEYARLNKAQQKAVDTLQGPLLVVAGPGTGKTQLLSMRVANILRKTDVYPDNILCLTFTNKATDNMRSRLQKLIGDESQGVQVKTFHGLAADIMNRYPEYFWRGAQLAIAADAIQLEIMQEVLARLPDDHPLALKFAGQFTLIGDVSRAINLAKEAGLTPSKLRAVIHANLAYIDEIEPSMKGLSNLTVSAKSLDKIAAIAESLPDQPIDELIRPLVSLNTVIQDSYQHAIAEYEDSGKTRSISKWKARWIQKSDGEYGMFDERRRNEWWLNVADAYEAYRKQMHMRGYYDYSDMLVEVIGQVEQHEDLRATLQEQFQYVLIDEFQDTNAAQLRLAHLIADHSELQQPNIMAVGDDDQSIFKFQGAELSNMLGFSRQYGTEGIIVLEQNYRSTQAVLDVTDGIIQHANYRLVTELPNLSKHLISNADPKLRSVIEHRAYRSRQEQLDGLAHYAGQLLQKGKSVAVLARHHSSLRDMAMLLHENGTPIAYEQSNDILEQPAIKQLYLLLKIIAHVQKGEISAVNELLAETLTHPMWNIPPEILWQLAISQQQQYDWLSGLKTSDHALLHKIGEWFEYLTHLSVGEPLAVVVEYALGLRNNEIIESPIQAYFLRQADMDEAYIETLSAVQTLRGLIDEFRSVRISKVSDFVRFVDLMKENGKIISDSSPFVSGEHSVELLSVHKAKGLEFDAVIIVDASESEWSPRSRGRVPPANLPLKPAEDDIDDYVRLMYVAATRSRDTLIFGSYLFSQKNESVLPAQSLSAIPVTKQKPAAGKELTAVLQRSLLWPRLEQKDEKALLKPRLETYSLNVSNLINFLDVAKGGPQYFKERNLLRLPEAKTASSAMGTAVHAALQESQLLHNTNRYDFATVQKVFDDKLREEGLPEIEYKRKLSEGRRLLKHFIETEAWEFQKGAKPEYVVSDVYIAKARLSGKLDLVDMTGEDTIVQDYKTGRALSSLSAASGDEGMKAWRHKIQLTFYALLLDIDPAIHAKGETICQMVYVESDKKSKLVLEYRPTKDDLTRLGTLVTTVWDKIQKLDLPDTSAYSHDLKGILAFEDDLINGKV